MSKRINIVLPDKTVAVLERVAPKGARSRFIDRAAMHLVEAEGKQNLRARLKAEALANAERDLAIAAEWFPLEEEAWQRLEGSSRARKVAKTKRPCLFPGEATSTWSSSTPPAATRSRRPGRPSSSRMTFRIVAAISSHFGSPPYPREVVLGSGGKTGLSQPSAVILNQIRSIDRQRLLKRIGQIDGATQQRVAAALKISLGLVEL